MVYVLRWCTVCYFQTILWDKQGGWNSAVHVRSTVVYVRIKTDYTVHHFLAKISEDRTGWPRKPLEFHHQLILYRYCTEVYYDEFISWGAKKKVGRCLDELFYIRTHFKSIRSFSNLSDLFLNRSDLFQIDPIDLPIDLIFFKSIRSF